MKKTVMTILFMWAYAATCYAQIEITEIMYDPSGTDTNHEWVEIYNNSNDTISLAGWKLYEANSNHGLVAADGGYDLSANSYAVIIQNPADFALDYPDVDYLVLDSSFSLLNTTESIAIKDNQLNVVDTVTYSSDIGASNDGNSLQLIDEQWVSTTPTPGSENVIADNPDPPPGDDNDQQVPPITKKEIKKQVLQSFDPYYTIATTIRPKNVVAGSSVAIDTDLQYITALEKLKRKFGIYTVNFGDGSISVLDKVTTLHHTWDEPGVYSMVVTFKTSNLVELPDAQVIKKIQVLPPNIVVSVSENGRTVLENTSKTDIGIGGWIVSAGHIQYTLPEGSLLYANQHITISDQVFDPLGMVVQLYTDTGIEVASSADKVMDSGDTDRISVSTTHHIENLDSQPVAIPTIPDTTQKGIPFVFAVLIAIAIVLIVGISYYALFCNWFSTESVDPNDMEIENKSGLAEPEDDSEYIVV